MTALILTIIAIAILSAWYDHKRIAGGHEIMHVPRWLIRSALAYLCPSVRTLVPNNLHDEQQKRAAV